MNNDDRKNDWLIIPFMLIMLLFALADIVLNPPTQETINARSTEAVIYHATVQAGTVNGVYCGCVMCGDHPCGFCILTCGMMDNAAKMFHVLLPIFLLVMGGSCIYGLFSIWRQRRKKKSPIEPPLLGGKQ